MQKTKLLFIFGTRPEAIKLAPLILRLKANPYFDVKTCSSGQHKELLDSVLNTFDVKPDHKLAVMTKGQSLAELTSKLMVELGRVIQDEQPDLVIVQGDTTTTMTGAMAAFYNKVRVAHIEAGLRTANKTEPFPEEMNRRIISQLADYHFCPTEKNRSNLMAEGIKDNCFVTGNTGLDATLVIEEKIRKEKLSISKSIMSLSESKFILVTIHRRENHGTPAEQLAAALKKISLKYEDLTILLIRHPNPKLSEFQNTLDANSKIQLLAPLGYLDMIYLVKNAHLLITDSGGLQEESAFLGTPTIVVRNTTERTEAIELGLTKIVPPKEENLISEVENILSDKDLHSTMSRPSAIYGEGNSALLIEKVLKELT